jgi:prepilin-type N-terminal cleavage/methylation domain-containing protein
MPTSPAIQRARLRGFTLLEVMIGVTILVGALLAVVGQYVNVRSTQISTEQSLIIDRLMQSLTERVNAANWINLGTIEAPWSLGRYEYDNRSPTPSDAKHTLPPLTEAAANTRDNLIHQGLLAQASGLTDLKVYFEWWRAVDVTNDAGVPDTSRPGALTGVYASKEAFLAGVYRSATDPTMGLKSAFDLRPTWDPVQTAASNSPTRQVGDNDPLLIRIVVTWNDGMPRRREIISGRHP